MRWTSQLVQTRSFWLTALLFITSATPSVAATEPPHAADRPNVMRFLRAYFLHQQDTPDPSVRVAIAFADLNGDRRPDAVVYVSGGGYCGSGGCTTVVLAARGTSYRVVMYAPITFKPVRLLQATTRGWRDIGLISKGELTGDRFEYDEIEESFRGARYRERRSASPIRPGSLPGRTLIAVGDPGTQLYP